MKRTFTFLCLLGALTLAAPVWAAEHGESFLAAHHTLVEVLVSVVNFLIFIGLLIKFAKAPLRKQFDNNANEFQSRMAEANRLLAEVQDIHREWTQRRERLDDETARIQADAQRLAEAQANEIIANAKQMAQRLVADAEQTAVSELALAKEDIRRELVDKLIENAEEKIRARLTPSHQRMLIEDAIKKLEAIS